MTKYIDTTFDPEFRTIGNLHWLPYVGKSFFGQKNRLLIVGESHYVPEGEDDPGNRGLYENESWTRAFILKEGLQQKDWFTDSRTNPLIQNVEKTIFGEKPYEKRIFWEGVSYHNIVQRLLDRLKVRPEFNDYKIGWPILFELIGKLKPHTIVFCGTEAANQNALFIECAKSNNYQTIGITKHDDPIGGTYPRSAKLKNDSGEIDLYFVRHPSRYYSWKKWNDFFNKQTNAIFK